MACIQAFGNSKCDGAVCLTNAYRNPAFNMVQLSSEGRIKLAIQQKSNYHRRQDAPSYYDLTTICYVFRSEFIQNAKHIFEGDLTGIIVPKETAIDIDDETDFLWAEFLAKRTCAPETE